MVLDETVNTLTTSAVYQLDGLLLFINMLKWALRLYIYIVNSLTENGQYTKNATAVLRNNQWNIL